jgi:hypothetical protein
MIMLLPIQSANNVNETITTIIVTTTQPAGVTVVKIEKHYVQMIIALPNTTYSINYTSYSSYNRKKIAATIMLKITVTLLREELQTIVTLLLQLFGLHLLAEPLCLQ